MVVLLDKRGGPPTTATTLRTTSTGHTQSGTNGHSITTVPAIPNISILPASNDPPDVSSTTTIATTESTTGTQKDASSTSAQLSKPSLVFLILGFLVLLIAITLCAVRALQIRRRKQSYHRHIAQDLHSRGSGSPAWSFRNLTANDKQHEEISDTGSFMSLEHGGLPSLRSPATLQKPCRSVRSLLSSPPPPQPPHPAGNTKLGFSPPPPGIPSHILQRMDAESMLLASPSVPVLPGSSLQRTHGAIRSPPTAQKYPVYVPAAETVAHAFLMLHDEQEQKGEGMPVVEEGEVTTAEHVMRVVVEENRGAVVALSPAQMGCDSVESLLVVVDGEDGSVVGSEGCHLSPTSAVSSDMGVRKAVMQQYEECCVAGSSSASSGI